MSDLSNMEQMQVQMANGYAGGGSGLYPVSILQPLPATTHAPAGLNTAPPTFPPSEPVVNYGTGYPVPGEGVLSPPDTVPSAVTINASTGPLMSPGNLSPNIPVDPITGAPTLPAPAAPFPWLLLAAVAGGVLLLSKSGPRRAGTVGKGGKSMLVPVLLVGGLGAYYLYSKREDPAVTARLLSWSTGNPQFPTLAATVAAMSVADRATLYTIITQYFDKNIQPPPDLQAFWNANLAAATTVAPTPVQSTLPVSSGGGAAPLVP
jgi:hypothetical protein